MAHANPLARIDVSAAMRAHAVLYHEGIHEDRLEATILARTIEQIMEGIDPAEIVNHIADIYGRSAD